MSLPLFIPSINELSLLLIKSHASNGGTVLLSRGGEIWNNPSTKSILNSWIPKNEGGRLLQASFLDLCGNGDGCKLGILIACSLLKSFIRSRSPHPDLTQGVKDALPSVLSQIAPLQTNEETLLRIGSYSGLDIETISKVSEAIYLSGASSSHISLEKYDGVGCEVEESESFHTRLKVHLQEEKNLKGNMYAIFSNPIFKVDQVLGPLELMGSFEGRPLVIVAPLIGGKALTTINLNRSKGIVEAYACDAPRVTWCSGWLEDLASFTGATVYDSKVFSSFKNEYFGSAIETLLNYNEMVVSPYDDHAERTSLRADFLLREVASIPHPHTQDLWRKRANSLNGTLVRLKVGGVTESEARWRRVLAEKSLISMMDASKNGHVEGSIPCLYNLKSENEILSEALRAPFRAVCNNLGRPSNDLSILNNPLLLDSFPYGRLVDLITKAVSIATTIGSVCKIVNKTKVK